MEAEKEHYRRIAVNLTRLTAAGKINWRRDSPKGAPDGAVWDAHKTTYNGTSYILRSAFAHSATSPGSPAARTALMAMSPQDYVLTAVTDKGRIVFPRSSAINNLAKLATGHDEKELQRLSRDLEQAANEAEAA